jgi:hypothetical protein
MTTSSGPCWPDPPRRTYDHLEVSNVKLRWDEDLADELIVVRGGSMEPNNLWRNAESVVRSCGRVGFCVGIGVGSTKEIVDAMPYRGEKVRTSTLGAIRAAGFDVVRVEEEDDSSHAVLLVKQDTPHADEPPTSFPDVPSAGDDIWSDIAALFGPPTLIFTMG